MRAVAREQAGTTARLVERFQAGEAVAFTELYRRHVGRVHAYLRAALHEESDVQDVAQRVFEAVFEALPAYRAEAGRFENWLLRIVRNQAIDHVRRNRRASPHDPEAMSRYREERDRKEGAPAATWGSSERLHQGLEELPQAQRQVLVLHYRVGLSGAEIARVLGVRPEHVRQLRHRALRALEARLGRR